MLPPYWEKSIMQAQQLLTQLSPVENPYAPLLYIFMALFERKPPDLWLFCPPLLTNPTELIINTDNIIWLPAASADSVVCSWWPSRVFSPAWGRLSLVAIYLLCNLFLCTTSCTCADSCEKLSRADCHAWVVCVQQVMRDITLDCFPRK